MLSRLLYYASPSFQIFIFREQEHVRWFGRLRNQIMNRIGKVRYQ